MICRKATTFASVLALAPGGLQLFNKFERSLTQSKSHETVVSLQVLSLRCKGQDFSILHPNDCCIGWLRLTQSISRFQEHCLNAIATQPARCEQLDSSALLVTY